MFRTSSLSATAPVFFLLLSLGLAALLAPPSQAQDAPAPVYAIEGNVAGPEGEPLEDADVALYKDEDGSLVKETTTDADGSYKFELLEANDYVVSAVHECCLRDSVDVAVGGTTLTTTAPTLQLAAQQPVESGDPVVLKGVVLDTADDGPLANVAIEIQSYWGDGESGCDGDVCWASPMSVQWFYVESDVEGAFELEINRGSATVRANLAGYDTTVGSFDMSEDREIEVPLRATQDNSVLLRGILTSSDGSAIADGWISVGPDYGWGGCPPYADCVASPNYIPPETSCDTDVCWTYESYENQWNSTTTGADGSWELTVAAGRLRLSASATDHLEAFELLETDAGDEHEVNLVLERIPPDSVTVTGRVVDRESGEPIHGASVSVENQRWGTWANAYTDEDGRYTISAKPGYNILTVSYYSYGCVAPAVRSEPGDADDAASSSGMSYVEPGPPCTPREDADLEYFPAARSFSAAENSELSFDFRLVPRPLPSSEFKGYVLSTNGSVVPGAVVTFYNELTRDWGSATTDEEGSYRIKVHAGYYSIRIWAQDHFDNVANEEIGSDASRRVDFTLEPGEKRYGYWAYGGYAVRETSAPGMGGPDQDEGAPMPADGQQAYEGAGGGLGPYHPMSRGGNAPAPGLGLIVLGLVCVVLLRRRLA